MKLASENLNRPRNTEQWLNCIRYQSISELVKAPYGECQYLKCQKCTTLVVVIGGYVKIKFMCISSILLHNYLTSIDQLCQMSWEHELRSD